MVRKHYLLSAAFSLAGFTATAQTIVAGTAYLEANNIRSSVSAYGTMWNNTQTGQSECEYPKNSGKHVGYASSIWLGGYDAGGSLKASAQTYLSSGFDYFPGPLDATTNTVSTATVQLWNKVWKVSQKQIDSAILAVIAGQPNQIPLAVKEWPAKGNILAAGFNGTIITNLATTTRDYAPFVDVNGDGKYNALQGDYPKIKGDEMLWWVFNDMGNVKTASGSQGIGIEIQASAYAYKRNTIADNIQFYEYTVFNRGNQQLDSAKIGVFADLDLGYYLDDFVGYDSTRNLAYQYNATSVDGNGAVGHYGANPPIAGITLLQVNSSNATTNSIADRFVYFTQLSGAAAAISEPTNALEYYRYLTGANKIGNLFTNDFTGAATPSTAYGAGPTTKYVYTGNPSTAGQWSECYCQNTPGDRKFLLSSKLFSLTGQSSYKIAYALVVAPGAGGCPNVNITGLQQTADTARNLYWNAPVAPIPTGISKVSVDKNSLHIFPNPTTQSVFVETGYTGREKENIRLMDALGKTIAVPSSRSNGRYELNVSALANGVYTILYERGGLQQSNRFVKE